METFQIIIDTNVLVAALRSKNGDSYRLIKLLHNKDERFQINVSTSIVLEYEAVLKREMHRQAKNITMIDAFIDDIVSEANRHPIFYLLRPHLKDADDDFILELAFSSAVDFIVTYNTKNFNKAKSFGVNMIKPKEFLQKIGDIS